MRNNREMIPRNVDWSKKTGRTLVNIRLQELGQLVACSGRGASKGSTLLVPFLKALDTRPQQWSQSLLGNGKSQANSAHHSNSDSCRVTSYCRNSCPMSCDLWDCCFSHSDLQSCSGNLSCNCLASAGAATLPLPIVNTICAKCSHQGCVLPCARQIYSRYVYFSVLFTLLHLCLAL